MKSRKVFTMGTLHCVLTCFLAMLLSHVEARSYWMDRQDNCGHIEAYDIQRDETVTIYAKTGDTLSSQGSCSLNFKAIDTDAKVQMQFTTFSIQDCGVTLYITGSGTGKTDTYKCGDSPKTWFSSQRSVTLTLHKTSPTANAYNFQIKLTAVRDVIYPQQNDAHPMAVGMVIGIVGAVFAVIIIVACVGVCCFRKYRTGGSSAKSPYLYEKNSKVPPDETSSHTSAGYTNDGIKAGSSPMAKKKLLQHSSSSSDRSDHNSRPYTLNLHRNNNYNNYPAGQSNNRNVPVAPPPPDMKSYETSPKSGNLLLDSKDRGDNVFRYDNCDTKKSANERVDVDTKSKNPVISALNGNSKFRKSMELNEKDAEARAKRISSASSLEGLGHAPTLPSSEEDLKRPPKLPAVPKAQQSPKSKHAVIKRNPRPTSVSSDELNQIERGMTKSEGGRRNRIINDDSSSSQSEVANINASDTAKKKFDTTHSLKPDRSRGPKGRKKQTQSVSSTVDQETLPKYLDRDDVDRESLPRQFQRDGLGRPSPKTQRDRILNEEFEKTGSGRYSKRANRSTPRSSAGKGYSKGFSHRRGRSADQLDSRPTTPTSAFGSMESLPPLARSSSKTSLYASRERLYDRRGRSPRRRQGSYSESIASTRDDMSIMRHSRGYDDYYSDEDDYDGYEKPLSRRDRERIYKSETDIGKNLKAVSTQTLRETATQTGPNETVDVKTKVVMKKKHRSKSVSSSGTQTKKNRNGRTKSSSESSDTEVNRTQRRKPPKGLKTVHSDSELKTKTKRSKSVDEIANSGVKPKPKPKPRKSTGTDLDDVTKSASMENLGPNPMMSVPQSEGFAPQAMYPGQYYPQMGYPMVPPPSYPGHPGFAPQGQPMQNPYPQPQTFGGMQPAAPVPSKPTINGRKKSNWEMLCELTDSGYARDDVTETGSVASSVFTNNPQSLPGYGMPPGGLGYYPPPVGYQPQMVIPVGQQQMAPAMPKEKTLNKQSSWDALKQVTVSSQQEQSGMRRNESIV